MSTAGTELLKQIMDGGFSQPATATVEAVREKVTAGLTELIDWGFRARPLLRDGVQVGLIRGLHLTERRQLFTWNLSSEARITHILRLGTTLAQEDIDTLDGIEAQRLLKLIDQITEADMSLYPYVSAYSTTSASEILWYGRGARAASWNNQEVVLPGGLRFTLLSPPDHARLWAGVAAMRERSKRRVEETYNSAIITRALTGKGADRLYASLKKNQQGLLPDIPDPWMKIVREDLKDVNFQDGWGHAHQDDTVEGILREVEGMAKMDKHERFMQDFYDHQMAEAKKQEREIEERFQQAMAGEGMEESITIMTPDAVRNIGQAEREQTRVLTDAVSEAMLGIQSDDIRRERRRGGP